MVYLIGALVCLITFLYFYYSSNYKFTYWEKRNVKHLKTTFLANMWNRLFHLKTVAEISIELCNQYPEEKVIGYYMGVMPILIVQDPLLLKHVSVTDFDHFSDRTQLLDEKNPIYKNLFQGDGDTWRLLKKSFSTAFTSSKLKKMFPLIIKCSEKLQLFGDKIVERGGIVNSYEMMSRFTVDFISSCGMGLDCGVFDEIDSKIFDFAMGIFHISKFKAIAIILQTHFPFITHFHNEQFVVKKKAKMFVDMISEVTKSRNYKPSGRHDFIDLILEVREQSGKLKGQSMNKKNPDGSPVQIELDLTDPVIVAAQVLVFFSAGFETSASSTSHTLHQLALHPEIQKRVQAEIDGVLMKYDNKLCYDAVSKMNFLEMVYLESLRMFPPGGVLGRVCTKQYTFPGTSTTIDPGINVIIPAAAMHMNERYFKNPHQFQPERFSPGYKERVGHVYYPFGLGKRMCIGSNMGQMQSLTGLVALLQRFTVEPAPHTQKKVKPDRSVFYLHKAEGGLPVKLIPRKMLIK